MTAPPVALTIAGSDSGGAAGIQADLKTFHAHGVFGTSAITALTVQNTVEVRDVHVPPPTFLRAQVEAVDDDLPIAAVKTGMLATAEIVEVVADLVATRNLPNLVVDPVMIASSGARLLDDDAIAAYRTRLLPHALVATPNVHEAAALLDVPIGDLDAQRTAARRLAGAGPRVVVVTGGHAVEGTADHTVDVVADRDTGEVLELTGPRIATTNTHGSGCSFASSIAASLALGHDPLDAIRRAHTWIREAIHGSHTWQLGAGHGPLDHWAPTAEQQPHRVGRFWPESVASASAERSTGPPW